jgi:hypothetical protein
MKSALVRLAAPEWNTLTDVIFSRYPNKEWATFARFGWRATDQNLVITLASVGPPEGTDLDKRVGHVAITEPYTLRIALTAERHNLAVGVIHSHPKECPPIASSIDDDMDEYYSSYFGGFAPDRPYVSLIASVVGGEMSLSGRIYWQDQWLRVSRFSVERTPVRTWTEGISINAQYQQRERTQRLSAAFGLEAAGRLRQSTVAVIGAGGTGSAAIEVLARAGVGHLVLVDPDHISESNLERVHGSRPEDVAVKKAKVALASEHVKSIDPTCEVESIIGSLPQKEILDAIVNADVVLGCTDQQHSRLALSDVAVRYLVPAIDCGVLLEGKDGKVTGQVLQLVRFLARDACALCRGMIDSSRVAQELMTEEEKTNRRNAADEARRQNGAADAYWRDLPQLNTVGYLTTVAGALAAGYAIGWLTGRFDPPFERLQMNLVAPYLDVTDQEQPPRPECICHRIRGWADQGIADALVSAPAHWPAAKFVGA